MWSGAEGNGQGERRTRHECADRSSRYPGRLFRVMSRPSIPQEQAGIGLIKIQAIVVGVAGVTPSIIIVAGIIRSIMFVVVDVGGESLIVVAESVATSRNGVNAFHFSMPGGDASRAIIEHR